jgi:hypothetical protein
MTILLNQDVRVGGSVLAAGTTQTLAADLEADIVARKMATVVGGALWSSTPNHPREHAAMNASVIASKVLNFDDMDKVLLCNHAATAIVLTVPPESDVPWSGVVTISAAQIGAASVSFTAGAGVTIDGTAPTPVQFKVVGIMRYAANKWLYL